MSDQVVANKKRLNKVAIIGPDGKPITMDAYLAPDADMVMVKSTKKQELQEGESGTTGFTEGKDSL